MVTAIEGWRAGWQELHARRIYRASRHFFGGWLMQTDTLWNGILPDIYSTKTPKRSGLMLRSVHIRGAFFLVLSALTPCAIAFAGSYNANWSGTVTSLNTYSYNDQIIFSLSSMPSLPSGTCSTAAFAISTGDTDAESRNRMYATLLSAYLTGQSITVGYDNTGASCSETYVLAYRVGF